MINAPKAHAPGDLPDGAVVAGEELLGLADAQVAEIFHRRNAVNDSKGLAKINGAFAAEGGKAVVGDIGIVIMLVDIIDCRLQQPLSIGGGIALFGGELHQNPI